MLPFISAHFVDFPLGGVAIDEDLFADDDLDDLEDDLDELSVT